MLILFIKRTGDVHIFAEICLVCQIEEFDHTFTKGKLQSTQILETKWSEIPIDFMTDLLNSIRNCDSMLVVVDNATKMVHFGPCNKGITIVDTSQLL